MRPTVRVRLTALYAGLFAATATAVLVIVNLLLERALEQKFVMFASVRPDGPPPSGSPSMIKMGSGDLPDPAGLQEKMQNIPGLTAQQRGQVGTANYIRNSIVHYQWTVTIVAIVLLTLVSAAAGWWLAGRMLRPLHRITGAAQRLSLSTLDQRIGLEGPRDELKELADTFDAMLERLERAVDSQRRFIANASHELRTPLAIQRAAIEIGLDDPEPARVAEMRDELLTANLRTERLIDGLLVLAQGERGLDAREPVDLGEVAAEAVAQHEAADVTVRLDAHPASVSGDAVLLARLAGNLVHNAIRYNRPGGLVLVRVDPDGTLEVSNTGPVVPQNRVGELFEPFRRLSRTADGGAGLGLSIVAAIAQAHGATVAATPNPGGGLTVRVAFQALLPV